MTDFMKKIAKEAEEESQSITEHLIGYWSDDAPEKYLLVKDVIYRITDKNAVFDEEYKAVFLSFHQNISRYNDYRSAADIIIPYAQIEAFDDFWSGLLFRANDDLYTNK